MAKKKDIFEDLILPTDAEIRKETFNDRRAKANSNKNKTTTMREKAAWNKGRKRPEHSKRMKESSPGLEKTRTNWVCPHCNKEGVGSSNYVRWHGDNCKQLIGN